MCVCQPKNAHLSSHHLLFITCAPYAGSHGFLHGTPRRPPAAGVHEGIESDEKDKIVFFTAGVAVLSLLVNGTTTGPLVRSLKLDRCVHSVLLWVCTSTWWLVPISTPI